MKLVNGYKISLVLLGVASISFAGISPSKAEAKTTIEIENQYVKYVIGSDGRNLHFVDKKTGTDYCVWQPAYRFARLTKGGREYSASAVSYADGRITVWFGDSGVSAVIQVETKEHYFVLEVLSISDTQVKELVFIDIALACEGKSEEVFSGCALALNLQTNVVELPGPNRILRAACYPRFGFSGARAAIIGCPQTELRNVMKEAVSAAEELPHSPIGGPWALDAETNRGSYIFNFENLTEETVDDWIAMAKNIGINQIDFHGGKSFRFGDFRPDPSMYPKGFESLKAVIDKLHAAGLKAGLHTYAFFIDKTCPWVRPVPDGRLAKDVVFTLGSELTWDVNTIFVVESTKDMSTVTGFHIRNSVTLQIDDELITYTGISKEPPYAFTGCVRGACGTKAAPHSKGAKVYHLKECFGRFVPDGDSTLFTEVAAKTAEAYNKCGFDMIYLDALDGEDIVAGRQNGWHYGSKFVFELCKRLKKPALMEMSTFHHHLWYVRSRMGAWDVPTRSRKKFVDLHCKANESCRRMFLPSHLGWWALYRHWAGPQGDKNFTDDIEYLCCKCIGHDAGLSMMGATPETYAKSPNMQRLAAIIRRYETLRLGNYFSESVKEKLRVAGDEFTLEQNEKGNWQLRPVQYAKHKVEAIDGVSNVWRTENKFGRQPVQLRIEALMSAGPYDASENLILADFNNPNDFPDRATASGITAKLQLSSEQVKAGSVSGCFSATNTNPTRTATWAKMRKTFSPPMNINDYKGMGVWIYGDGKGEVLNFQITSPRHLTSGAIGERYVVIDFNGWRYFELIESEGERFANYSWPYGNAYSIHFFSINYNNLESLSLWYNNIPPEGTVSCYLSPIKAVPLVKEKLINPSVTIGGKTIVFPVEIESESYLEFKSMDDCKLYDSEGKLICEVKPQGEVPVLVGGENQVRFSCNVEDGLRARVNVTLISRGESPLYR